MEGLYSMTLKLRPVVAGLNSTHIAYHFQAGDDSAAAEEAVRLVIPYASSAEGDQTITVDRLAQGVVGYVLIDPVDQRVFWQGRTDI